MKIYSVDECSKFLYQAIDKDYIFKKIAVRGTISNLRTHFLNISFFTLLSDKSRISCFIGKAHHTFLTRNLQNGKEASIVGDLKFDKMSGRPVLYVSRILDVKVSALKEDRDALQRELEAAGYFNPGNKQALPLFPFHIGIITSGSGAVVHDIIRTGRMRNDAVRYTLFNSLVQGEGAALHLAKMVHRAENLEDPVDILIIARGGGAEEDLAPFADRVLLDAVFSCRIPVISAVGHETDTTLLDLVADCRASTPTQAAEIAIPEKKILIQGIAAHLCRLREIWAETGKRRQMQLENLCSVLKDGKHFSYRKDSIEERMHRFLIMGQSAVRQRKTAERQTVHNILMLMYRTAEGGKQHFPQYMEFWKQILQMKGSGKYAFSRRKDAAVYYLPYLRKSLFLHWYSERAVLANLLQRFHNGNKLPARVFYIRLRENVLLLKHRKYFETEQLQSEWQSLCREYVNRINRKRKSTETLAVGLLLEIKMENFVMNKELQNGETEK